MASTGPSGLSQAYYVWVDIHDIFGLGKDTVIVLDNQSDGSTRSRTASGSTLPSARRGTAKAARERLPMPSSFNCVRIRWQTPTE